MTNQEVVHTGFVVFVISETVRQSRKDKAREYVDEHGLDIEELGVLSTQLSNAAKRLENQQALTKVADLWDAAQTQRERAQKAQEEEDDERALEYLTAATREIRTALEKAEDIGCIDTNRLEEANREIAAQRTQLRTRQISEQRQAELQEAEEMLSQGEEALTNDAPVEALSPSLVVYK